MLDWNKWAAVLHVAREGTLAGGAERLRIDATTVSRRIKTIESKLRTKLFFRNGRRHIPTAQCREMLSHLEQAATSINAAHQSGHSELDNKMIRNLRISAPPYFVDHILAPNLHFLLQKRNLRANILPKSDLAALTHGEVDFAIVVDDQPKGSHWDKKRISVQEIGLLSYSVYQSKNHNYVDLPWAGLLELPEVRTGGALMDKLAAPQGLQIQVPHFEALAKVLVSGVAKGLLPVPVASNHETLIAHSDILLQQPVFLLSKIEDADIEFLSFGKAWLIELLEATLSI
jgi:DNA-binding transcriptional LysR family regulator